LVTPDPIRDGINWYTYGGNNPVNAIDPEGVEAWTITEVVQGVAGAVPFVIAIPGVGEAVIIGAIAGTIIVGGGYAITPPEETRNFIGGIGQWLGDVGWLIWNGIENGWQRMREWTIGSVATILLVHCLWIRTVGPMDPRLFISSYTIRGTPWRT